MSYFCSHYRYNHLVFGKSSEITAENNKRQFFKQVLNILCKVTGNGLRHSDVIRVNMPVLTSEDKALIKVLRVEKGWDVDRMMSEFPVGLYRISAPAPAGIRHIF